MRRGRVAVAALACVGGIVMAVGAGPACFDRSCDPGPVPDFGAADSGQGNLITDDTWESVAADAPWPDYGGNAGYNFYVPRWIAENRPVAEMHAFISDSPRPGVSGNYTEGSGNAVEWSLVSPGRVSIFNATCAHFYVRVVLRGGRPLVDAGPLDAADAPAE